MSCTLLANGGSEVRMFTMVVQRSFVRGGGHPKYCHNTSDPSACMQNELVRSYPHQALCPNGCNQIVDLVIFGRRRECRLGAKKEVTAATLSTQAWRDFKAQLRSSPLLPQLILVQPHQRPSTPTITLEGFSKGSLLSPLALRSHSCHRLSLPKPQDIPC